MNKEQKIAVFYDDVAFYLKFPHWNRKSSKPGGIVNYWLDAINSGNDASPPPKKNM